MNIRLVLNLLGRLLLIDSALMAPAFLIALFDKTPDAGPLGITMALTAALGALMALVRPRSDTLRAREGFTVVAVTWVLLSFLGGLPFYFSGYIPSLVDCFFEIVSGYTTTGSTILTDVEVLPRGLLFWRSFTHWVGGMGVLVLSLALLPRLGGRSVFLMRAESPGPSPGKLVPRIGQTAKILYALYLGLSVLMFMILMLCGMDWFDAIIHTVGTAGTGGFSNYNLSVGHFQNPLYEGVIGVFLLLFGVNFSMYFYLLSGEWRTVWKNSELRLYFGVVAGSILLIAINILPQYDGIAHAVRDSFFQVMTIITTAGFATADFNLWPMFSKIILLILMMIGCCAGSTGGGLKLIRVAMLFKGVKREIHRTVHPRGVSVIRIDGRAVDEDIFSSVAMYFFGYMAVIIIATLIVAMDNFDFESTFTAVVACFNNIGPGFGMVGPMGNFSQFSDLSKITLSICMLLGRLELYPILLLMSRRTWTRH